MAYPSKRLLLFTAKLGYQTRSFKEAARKLNVQLSRKNGGSTNLVVRLQCKIAFPRLRMLTAVGLDCSSI